MILFFTNSSVSFLRASFFSSLVWSKNVNYSDSTDCICENCLLINSFDFLTEKFVICFNIK